MKFVRSYHVAQLGRNVIKPTLLQVAVVRPESNFINAYEGLLKYGLEVAHFERNKWLTLERNMHNQEKYAETHLLRTKLNHDLADWGVTEVGDGVANFLLFYLRSDFISVDKFLRYCKAENLFLRDVSDMGQSMGTGAVRIAVKVEATNKRMIAIIENLLVKVSV